MKDAPAVETHPRDRTFQAPDATLFDFLPFDPPLASNLLVNESVRPFLRLTEYRGILQSP